MLDAKSYGRDTHTHTHTQTAKRTSSSASSVRSFHRCTRRTELLWEGTIILLALASCSRDVCQPKRCFSLLRTEPFFFRHQRIIEPTRYFAKPRLATETFYFVFLLSPGSHDPKSCSAKRALKLSAFLPQSPSPRIQRHGCVYCTYAPVESRRENLMGFVMRA